MKFVSSCKKKKKKKESSESKFKLEIIRLYRIFPITRSLPHILPSPLCLPPDEYIVYSCAVVFSPLYSAAFIIVSFFSTQSTFYRSRISFVPFSLSPSSLFSFSTLHSSLSLSLHVPLLPFFPSNLGQAPFNSSIHVYFDYIIEIIFKFIKFSRDV